MEIVALIRTDWDERGTHGPTVHITRNVAVHVGDFVQVEIITCRETEVPVRRRSYVAAEAEVLAYLATVMHLFVVEGAIAVIERVVERKIPGYRPRHITVRANRESRFFFALSLLVRLIIAGFLGELLVHGFFVLLLFAVILVALEGVVVECVAERRACGHQSREMSGAPAGLIDTHRTARGTELVGVDIPCGIEVEVEVFGEP